MARRITLSVFLTLLGLAVVRPAAAGAATTSRPADRPLEYGHVYRDLGVADMLCDPTGGACAYAEYYQYGLGDVCGTNAGPGHWMLFVWASEEVKSADTTFQSSPANFRVLDGQGHVYQPQSGCAVARGGRFLSNETLSTSVAPNTGWLEFRIPARTGLYTLLWDEAGVIPYRRFSDVLLGSAPAHGCSHPTRV